MVNRFYVLLTLLLGFVAFSNAQVVDVNMLSTVEKGSRVNFKMDFSDTSFMGMTEDEYSKQEVDWQKDKHTVIEYFLKALNAKLRGNLKLNNNIESDYSFVVRVISISKNGFMICDATLYDKHGTVLFKVKDVSGGKEPPISAGTVLSRIKIWSSLTGAKLGSILKKEFKNRKE